MMRCYAHRDHCEPGPLDDVVVVGVVVSVPARRVHVHPGHHRPDGRLHHGQTPPDGVIQSEGKDKKQSIKDVRTGS